MLDKGKALVLRVGDEPRRGEAKSRAYI
eukprot:COSAG06_NODE_34821_length_468_cov_5.832451_1_plen_27_part_10